MAQASGAGDRHDMPAAPDPAGPASRGPDPEAAETYLRLLAEAELRTALALPRARQPGDRIPATVATWAGNIAGTVAGIGGLAIGQVRSRTAEVISPSSRRVSGIGGAGPSGSGVSPGYAVSPRISPARRALHAGAAVAGLAARRARSAAASGPVTTARQAVAPGIDRAGRELNRVSWLTRWAGGALAEQLTRLPVPRLSRRPDEPSASDCLERVQAAADVLSTAGALDQAVAQSVPSGFARALMARRLQVGGHISHMAMFAHGFRDAGPAPPGPYRTAAVDATVRIEQDGHRAELHLLTLVQVAQYAFVTTLTRRIGPASRQRVPDPGGDEDDGLAMVLDMLEGRARDDRGGRYEVSNVCDCEEELSPAGPWPGHLIFDPAPAAGIDWLEIELPGQDPIRVDMTAGDDAPAGQPCAPLVPGNRAERIIDSVAVSLLPGFGENPEDAAQRLAAMGRLIPALCASRALSPGSAALARLATTARRCGLPVPRELAEAGGTDLPAAWRAVLDQGTGLADGRAGTGTAAAVMPELEGRRCVLAGLRAGATSLSIRVLGWGGPSRWEDPVWQELTWWARDDTGRWHLGHETGDNYDYEQASVSEVVFVPPVPPGAASLEVILSGLSGQVSATLPLDLGGRA